MTDVIGSDHLPVSHTFTIPKHGYKYIETENVEYNEDICKQALGSISLQAR